MEEAAVSLRTRLVVTMPALVPFGLAVADGGTYVALRSFLLKRLDHQLNVVSTLTTDYVEQQASQHKAIEPFFDPGSSDFFNQGDSGTQIFRYLAQNGVTPSELELRTPDGRALKSVQALTAVPRLPTVIDPGASPGDVKMFSVPSVRRGGGQWRIHASRMRNGYILVYGMNAKDAEETLGHLRQVEAATGVLVLLGVALLARRAARRGLRPLEEIGETARAIGSGDLARRVEPASERTEVGRLGLALNAMLGQLEAAFREREASERRLRRFVADASHELRTPLTSIRGYAELFRRGASARPTDLGKAIADARVVEPARPLRLDLERDGPVVVPGDADRLRQVLANLLANVRQHTPAGTAATVRAAQEGRLGVLEVADDGPGLDVEQRERVFERFYRADPARPRRGNPNTNDGGSNGEGSDGAAAGGAGLGLAIVAAVAAAHGGRATVASAPGGGARFRVELPLDGDGDGEAGELTGISTVPQRVLKASDGVLADEPERKREPTAALQEGPPLMTPLSNFVLRHKLLIGLFWLVVLLVGGATASKVSGRLSQEFSLPGSKSYDA